jgi:hypothetical protein
MTVMRAGGREETQVMSHIITTASLSTSSTTTTTSATASINQQIKSHISINIHHYPRSGVTSMTGTSLMRSSASLSQRGSHCCDRERERNGVTERIYIYIYIYMRERERENKQSRRQTSSNQTTTKLNKTNNITTV